MGDIERMLGAMEERSIRTLEAVERIDKRQIDIEKRIRKLELKNCSKHDDVVHDITSLKLRQEQIIATCTVEDEKLRGLLRVNNIKVSGITTALILVLQWIASNLKIG
jgi:hypothetical protein